MRRTTEFGGNYTSVQRGLPLGASISPLLGGLYLTPMDALFQQQAGIFYRRYMDDWIIMQKKRHGLRQSVKLVYNVLNALGMQTHPDKTFIGKGNKGFDFLGFAIRPTGLTVSDAALSRRDKKIARLYEQGASKRRIGLYLARWLGWATCMPSICLGIQAADGTDHYATLYGSPDIRYLCSGSLTNHLLYGFFTLNHTNPVFPGLSFAGLSASAPPYAAFSTTKLPTSPSVVIFRDKDSYCWLFTYDSTTTNNTPTELTSSFTHINQFLIDNCVNLLNPNTLPSVANTVANQAVNDNATVQPFSGVTLADTDTDNLSVTITLDSAAKGTLSASSIPSGPIATVQTALQAITFTPTANRVAVGSTETTTFTLTVNDGTGDTDDSTTTVDSTSINDAPTITGVTVSGTVEVGQSLNAAPTGYDDVDVDPDIQGTHLYQWHTGTDASCAGKTDISGANNSTYNITNSSIGKSICVTLTPKDADGEFGIAKTGTTSATVPKLDQTITGFNPATPRTYGDTPFSLSATSGASTNDIVYSSSSTSVCTVSTNTVTIHSAGTCTLTADEAADSTYNAAPTVSKNVTIAKADITATAGNASRAYGAANPSFTATYSGLVNSETAPSTLPDLKTTANETTSVGTDTTISCTATTDTNYNTTTCTDGTLTITKANSTTHITSDNSDPSAIGQSITVNVSVASATSGTPTGTVTVNDGNSNTCDVTLSTGIGNCQLTPANGNTTLTATYNGDSNFNGSSETEAHASIAAGIQVDVIDGVSLAESGTTDTYTLSAITAPTSPITVTITTDAQTEVSVLLLTRRSEIVFANTATVTINNLTKHFITVKAIDDDSIEGNHTGQITHAITAGDSGDYATSLSISPVDASISDNDPGVIITPSSGSTSVTEGGATDSFDVVLNTQPTDDVTITVSPDTQTTVDIDTLTFTNSDWQTAQTVEVTAVDDTTVENNHSSTISLSASSADTNYEGTAFSVDGTVETSLSVDITDNDRAGPTPSPSPPLPSKMTVTMKFGGNGFGKVTSSPTGIDCNNDNAPCEQTFKTAEFITLNPVAKTDSEFVYFSGSSSDCQKERIFLTSDVTCTAYFKYTGVGIGGKQAICPDSSIVYVNPDVIEGTGCSWESPFTDLQTVLTAIADGALPNVEQIWLHAGTYKPTNDNRQATFQLQNGVAIYGGFAGYETDLNQRNSSENKTLLSGDIGIKDDTSDNSIHIVTGSGTDATAQLNGVSISGGNADKGDACPEACGGGIYIDHGSPTLKHVFLQGNSAIYGGGIYSGNGSSPLIKESMINNNTAKEGGGLLNDNSTPVITHVFITGNTASHQGGGMLNQNQAKPLLSHVNMSGNIAELGGGILNDGSAPVVSHSILSDNEAENGGALVNLNQSNPLLSHVIISGNVASEKGGAIWNRDSAPVISQSTITENIAPNGSGIVNENSPITVNNSILWENQDSQVGIQIVDDPANPSVVNYSIIQGGWIGLGKQNLATDPLFAESVTDDISKHTTMGDFHLKAGSPAIDAGNNALIPIDKADAECSGSFGDGNTTEQVDFDFDGRTRIVDAYNLGIATVDMGAYEVQSMDTPVYSLTVSKTGTGDGSVSSNKAGINCGTDCNHDYISGTVVNLISRTEPGAILAGWRGACSGTNGSFRVIMDSSKQCEAQFDIAPEPETQTVPIPSGGTVPTSSGSSGGVPACSTFSGTVDANCNAGGQTITDLEEIEEDGQVANATIVTKITSKGWLSNVTVGKEGIVSGGIVTGYTKVTGRLEDFTHVGASVSGLNEAGEVIGTIGGKVILASQVGGVVKDIRLAPGTQIVGRGKPSVGSHKNPDRIGGTIIGDSQKPATLERVHIRTKSRVSNVIVQKDVTYDEGVTFTNVEFRTQVVRKVILKGSINGTRFKETYTRVESITIRANSHLSNLEIGNGVVFEEGVTLGENVTFSVHKKYRETHRTIVDLPQLDGIGALDSEGNKASTLARLEGGARLVEEGKPVGDYQKIVIIKRSSQKKVEIIGNVLTDVRHIGKKADILVVAAYTSPNASPSFYMLDNKGTPLPWDGVISSLLPFQEKTTLVPIVPLPIWNNPLDIVGDVRVYFGYRLLDTNVLVFSAENVIEMTLTP